MLHIYIKYHSSRDFHAFVRSSNIPQYVKSQCRYVCKKSKCLLCILEAKMFIWPTYSCSQNVHTHVARSQNILFKNQSVNFYTLTALILTHVCGRHFGPRAPTPCGLCSWYTAPPRRLYRDTVAWKPSTGPGCTYEWGVTWDVGVNDWVRYVCACVCVLLNEWLLL